MKHIKSERLKKLETELHDLEQWLKMGLVPKRDVQKHTEEIASVRQKIDEEQERLRFLKESGDIEEYIAPKKAQGRSLTDMPVVPDLDQETTSGGGRSSSDDSSFGLSESTHHGYETSYVDKEEETEHAEDSQQEDLEEESYFSEKNRWKRGGGIIDPDADDW